MNRIDVNIYVGNNGKKDGVEDYLAIFGGILARDRRSFKVSNRYVPGVPNLVIEEFTNYFENKKIARFREQYPDTPLILVLTEFMETKWGVQSLNHFGGVKDSALIVLINILVLYRRNDFRSARIKDWVWLIVFLPILLVTGIEEGARFVLSCLFPRSRIAKQEQLRTKIYRLSYWHLRYHGLLKNVYLFDHIIASHEKIWPQMTKNKIAMPEDNRFLGVVYPEFRRIEVLNKLFVDKKNKIELTGTISNYRQSWTDKINFQILSHGLHHMLGMMQNISWGEKIRKKERAAFSLHPPKTRNWPYSSPTRIYRALQYDGNIPVLAKYFGQNPIEDVCLQYRGVDTLVEMIEYWNNHASVCNYISQKMMDYNEIATRRNDKILRHIFSETSTHSQYGEIS